ncbi:MAG: MBL fold metallo-hydrolase [Proteobacteria bacterium]|nr:MBL fold metallo-hydrolase [Pseudomonadota bacterium]MBI3496079.1 MBL fold metallo-hydrolase [Pseudomonadota bacterium]
MRVTILGCGSSGGVPLVGDQWGNCDPKNPKNRRLRVSILVEEGDTKVLVDTSPDLREQLLRVGVGRLDGVVYTHGHADHLHGIDDLRGVNQMMRTHLDIWATEATLETIRQRFGYVFKEVGTDFFYKPVLVPRVIDGAFEIGSVAVVPFRQDHGYSETLGLRFGRIAYSTDVHRLDEAAYVALAGIDTWIVDCVREEPHPTHSHLAQTLEWIRRVQPRRAVLTHMGQWLDYEELRAKLPPGVEPGYDGMVLEA